MSVEQQIEDYITGLPELKRADMRKLHEAIVQLNPTAKLWYLDGKDASGKVVSNPSVGYGSRPHKYADGSVSDFYQVGLSVNKSGISVYILGIEDKKYLAETYGDAIGKATVTGYCVKFKALKDINLDLLEVAIQFGLADRTEKTGEQPRMHE